MKNALLSFLIPLMILWGKEGQAGTMETGPGGITIHGSTNACKGSQYNYEVRSPNPAYTYVWTVTGGTLISSTATTATVLWTNPPTGTITVEAFNGGVLVDDGTKGVAINEEPDPFITSDVSVGCASQIEDKDRPSDPDDSDCFTVCQGTQVVFTANGGVGSNFSWNATGGTIVSTSGNTATVQFNTIGFGQITVEETTTAGCKSTDIRCVEVIEKPKADFTIIPQVVFDEGRTCTFRELNFIDLSSAGNGSPIISWQWDFGDGTYSNDPNPSHTYIEAGSYTITLVVENECHCKDEISFEIRVEDAKPIEIDCPSVVCENQEVTYTANEDGCQDFRWDVTGGTVTSGDPTSGNFVGITWDDVDESGFGYISITSHCGDDCPTSIKVPVVKSVGVIQGEQQLCESREYLYRLPRWPATNFNWSITGDAQIYPTDQPNEIVVIPYAGGTNATLRCTYQNDLINCGGKASLDLNIVPVAEASGPEEACIGVPSDYELSNGFSGNWVLRNQAGTVVATGSGNTFSPTFTSSGTHLLSVSGSSFCSPDPLEIEVMPKPPMADQIIGPEEICLNIPYTFTTGNSIPGTTLNWSVTGGNFPGSGSVVSGESATVTFTGAGPYQLQVWREYQSDLGCKSDVLVKSLSEKQISLNIGGNSPVCANTYQDYEATYPDGDLYEWSIIPETKGSVVAGNGSSNITVLWNNATTSTSADLEVKMRVCDVVYTQTIPISIFPSVDLTIAGNSTVCRGEVLNLSVSGNPTLTGPYTVEWDFGDGTTATTSSASTTHTYTNLATGSVNYTVTATINNPNGCSQPATDQHVVTVEPAPVAFISPPGDRTFCPNATINETLTATVQSGLGATANYEWFKDGVSVLSGPTASSYTVTAAGVYYCKVTSNNGCSDNTNSVEFRVTNCSGTGPGCYYANSSDISLSYVVSDCGEITVNASYPSWGFNADWSGTPVSSSSTSATYQFNKAGKYGIKFEVDRTVGTQTCTYSKTIQVVVPYIGKLKYEVSCGSPGQYQVTLLDFSNYYPGTTLNYEFFISGTSVQSGTSTSYTTSRTPGTYPIQLVVGDGTNPNCTINDVINLPAMPVANFDFDFDWACMEYPIQFQNLSTPASGLEYEWDFNDGATVKVENPSRAFATGGTKTVALTVTNKLGCSNTISKTVHVSNNSLVGSILPSSAVVCGTGPLQLNYNPSSGTPDTYYWQPDSFAIVSHPDNSTTVMESGSYFVTVTDANKCTYSTPNVSVEFVPVPQAVITGPSDVCVGEELKLYGDAGAGDYDYQWSIISGPATFSSTDPNVTLSTGWGGLTAGTYVFELEVSTNTPIYCSRTTTFTVEVHNLPAPPDADFALDQCDPYRLKLFVNNPQSGTYTWSDGQSGSAVYVNKGGEYTVTYINPYGCSSETTIDAHKSPWEYIWIYPLGCYELCREQVPGETFDIPDPIIDFDDWGIYHNGSPVFSGSSGLPDVQLPGFYTPGSFSFDYALSLNGCTANTRYIDLEINEECCKLHLEPKRMEYKDNGRMCYNFIDIFIDNTWGQPITVSLSSDKGTFVPNTVTVPPGGANFTFEFFPFANVLPGSTAILNAVSTISHDPDRTERCFFEGEIELPNPMCEATDWKRAEAAAEAENAGLFQLAPNPANSEVRVIYELPEWNEYSKATLEVHDLRGARMATFDLVNGEGSQMLNTTQWKPSVYIIILRVNGEVNQYRRLVIQR